MQDIRVSTASNFLSQTQDTKLTFKVARNGDLLENVGLKFIFQIQQVEMHRHLQIGEIILDTD